MTAAVAELRKGDITIDESSTVNGDEEEENNALGFDYGDHGMFDSVMQDEERQIQYVIIRNLMARNKVNRVSNLKVDRFLDSTLEQYEA